MSDEELAAVQEELAAARSELEQLQTAVADREARATHVEEQLAEARDELAQIRNDAQSREQELAEQVRGAAQRYRALALEHAPELPEELVIGETVDEVDQSLERARETVSRVRGHLEAQTQAGRVPVGAPPRSGPDPATLTAEEKIRLGLQQGGG